jgi:hypothetical protein
MPINSDPPTEGSNDAAVQSGSGGHSSVDAGDEFATVAPASELAQPAIIDAADALTTVHPQSSKPKPPSAGSQIRYFGDYELLNEVARGGMGVVFKARQLSLNRVVALKMILSGEMASEEDIRRFYMEAEAAANLDHPGIVPVFEIGQHNGHHFFSMGFMEGKSIAELVRSGPLPPRQAAEITRKIADAIDYAHRQGVIHRDLKPANVLLDGYGEPKVTDFGLAKNLIHDIGLTQTGTVMGTPSYMSPEQAKGMSSAVGPLTDVYSLGAILYCLLTGRPPFQSSNVLETLRQVVEVDPVSPGQLNPEVDSDLETICLKCLEKDVRQRLCSAHFLTEELDRYLGGYPIESRRAGYSERLGKWCLRNRAEAALVVTVLVAVLLGSMLIAVAGLSEIQMHFGKDNVSQALFVMCLLGPAVTVARLLGLRGVRTLELSLMRIWKNCVCSIHAAVAGFICLAGVWGAIFIVRFGLREGDKDSNVVPLLVLLTWPLSHWIQKKYSLRPGPRWMWGLLCFGIILYIFASALDSELCELFALVSIWASLLILGVSLNYGYFRLIYFVAQPYVNAVRRIYGWVPWPFTFVARPFRAGQTLLFLELIPFAFVVGSFQLLLSVCMALVVLPIWFVEQLRLILLPDSPMVSESVCYLISAGAFATLLASLVM